MRLQLLLLFFCFWGLAWNPVVFEAQFASPLIVCEPRFCLWQIIHAFKKFHVGKFALSHNFQKPACDEKRPSPDCFVCKSTLVCRNVFDSSAPPLLKFSLNIDASVDIGGAFGITSNLMFRNVGEISTTSFSFRTVVALRTDQFSLQFSISDICQMLEDVSFIAFVSKKSSVSVFSLYFTGSFQVWIIYRQLAVHQTSIQFYRVCRKIPGHIALYPELQCPGSFLYWREQ